MALYGIFIENLGVNPKLLEIWRALRDFSRTPGWKPLPYIKTDCNFF